VTRDSGGVAVALPDGTVIPATDTGGGGSAAALSDGSIVTGNPDGTSSIQHADGSTDTYSAGGQQTGSAAANLDGGASVDAPPPTHDVTVPTSDGGYRVDHPDGSSDIHYPDRSVVHVEPDQLHSHQIRAPRP
jgi:hypothetical protein